MNNKPANEVAKALGEVSERQIKLVFAAIDAIINLEAEVYTDGLSCRLSSALSDLRSKQDVLQFNLVGNERKTPNH